MSVLRSRIWQTHPVAAWLVFALALSPIDVWAESSDNEGRSVDSEPVIVRVELVGYAAREDAERDARTLEQAGIETWVRSDAAEGGFAVSAGAFQHQPNVRNMRVRLEELGFANVRAAPVVPMQPPQPATAGQHQGQGSPSLPAEPQQEAPLPEPSPDDGRLSHQPQYGFPPDDPGISRARFGGFFQNEAAYAVEDPEHWQRFRNRLFLNWDGRLNQHVTWRLSGWGAYDPIFSLTDFYPQEVRDDREAEAMLRETYLDIETDAWQFRLGRQQVIWGEMVGLFFADVVSARDLREFIARDFELIRTPQWAARAEYFSGNLHGELLWIPFVTYDDIGVPSDDYYPGPRAVDGFDPQVRSPRTPPNTLANSSYGGRLSRSGAAWDLAAFYFAGYDLSPVFAREITHDLQPAVVFQPEHRRMQQTGLTASRDLGGSVLKAEAIYNRDRWFSVTRPDDPDGLVSQDFLDYIFGLDLYPARNTEVNLQFFQRRFRDHDPDTLQKRIESGASVYLSSWFPRPRLRPQLLLVGSLERSDWMARPRVVWEPPGDWRFTFGVDVFDGPPEGLFGRFSDGDRVYSEIRLDF